jgi:hypothetical protein
VLIDSPVLGGWRARTLEVFKRTRLVKAVSPGKISRKRRHQWPDAQSAFEHFARKPSFARWEPQVLRDYVDNGTRETATPQGSLRVLDFEREIETAIYPTTSTACCGAIRCAARWDSSAVPSRWKCGRSAWA